MSCSYRKTNQISKKTLANYPKKSINKGSKLLKYLGE